MSLIWEALHGYGMGMGMGMGIGMGMGMGMGMGAGDDKRAPLCKQNKKNRAGWPPT